jgi:hypothetical protein
MATGSPLENRGQVEDHGDKSRTIGDTQRKMDASPTSAAVYRELIKLRERGLHNPGPSEDFPRLLTIADVVCPAVERAEALRALLRRAVETMDGAANYIGAIQDIWGLEDTYGETYTRRREAGQRRLGVLSDRALKRRRLKPMAVDLARHIERLHNALAPQPAAKTERRTGPVPALDEIADDGPDEARAEPRPTPLSGAQLHARYGVGASARTATPRPGDGGPKASSANEGQRGPSPIPATSPANDFRQAPQPRPGAQQDRDHHSSSDSSRLFQSVEALLLVAVSVLCTVWIFEHVMR